MKQYARYDGAFQRAICERDSVCLRCFQPAQRSQSLRIVNLSAHHVLDRDNLAARWDLRNGLSFCWDCHSWVEQNPKRGNPECHKLLVNLQIWPDLETFERWRHLIINRLPLPQDLHSPESWVGPENMAPWPPAPTLQDSGRIE